MPETCPTCGAAVAPNADFCGACGVALPKNAASALPFDATYIPTGPISALAVGFLKCVDFRSRASRSEIWLWTAASNFLAFAPVGLAFGWGTFLDATTSGDSSAKTVAALGVYVGLLWLCFVKLLCVVPDLAVAARRLNDFVPVPPGPLVLGAFIAFCAASEPLGFPKPLTRAVFLAFVGALFLFPGKRGPNRRGDAPKRRPRRTNANADDSET